MAKRAINIKSNSSALREQSSNESDVFNMTLRKIPASARGKFKELKDSGKVSGSMNSYIINAFIRQLQKDDQ
ncbi:TPA: hypothetical protein ACMDN8_004527 [Vibrio parahaemolyticus]|nr:hypothetical protein [Vibrio parahaemolyticus]